MRITLEEALKKYWKSAYLAAYQLCQNIQDAEDAAEDAFLRYYESRKQFDNEEHLKAWLLRTAVNRAKDMMRSFWHRKKTVLQQTDEGEALPEFAGDPLPSAEEEILLRDRAEALTQAVAALPERCRLAIHLYYYEDASCEEIAEILGISSANARKRLSRGRQMLKEQLQEDFADD